MKKNSKEKIISAATELFITKGYDNVKMEDIATKAGVTKMMLYYYYDSKQEILKTIIKNLIEIAIEKISEIEFEKEFLLPASSLIQKITSVIEDKKLFLAFVFSQVLTNKFADFLFLIILENFMIRLLKYFQNQKSKMK